METINLKFNDTTSYHVSEAYKSLRTNILFSGADVKVIDITSTKANEGKSTVSLELAKSLAEAGKSVLMIDADLRKSFIAAKHAPGMGTIGLSQYLVGQASVDDVIYSTQISGLYIIFSGRFPPNPVELLGAPRFEELLNSAKNIFDYIIIDTPPLGMVIDSAVVASKCDGTIIVVDVNSVRYKYVKMVQEQLNKVGCRILGVILNRAKDKRSGYYKHYNSKYGGYGYLSEYTPSSGSTGDSTSDSKPNKGSIKNILNG